MIIVPGPVQLYVGPAMCAAGASSAFTISSLDNWARLGQTESGVQVSISNRAHRVNVDDMGGQQGSPADLIYLGSSASIRGTLVDYGEPNADSLSSKTAYALYGISRGLRVPVVEQQGEAPHLAFEEGDISAPGTPLFERGYGFAFFLSGVGCSYLFPKCEFASVPREWNVSSLERRTTFTVTAYEVPAQISSSYDPAYTGSYDGRRLYYKTVTITDGSTVYQSCRTSIHGDVTSGS